ncbi:hypothetical protein QVD99_004711 [Batrachochytrium dendrobatidis]|nr:hypothetical protein QVD99_004711 [Batrachochytrium dendrobatidis]
MTFSHSTKQLGRTEGTITIGLVDTSSQDSAEPSNSQSSLNISKQYRKSTHKKQSDITPVASRQIQTRRTSPHKSISSTTVCKLPRAVSVLESPDPILSAYAPTKKVAVAKGQSWTKPKSASTAVDKKPVKPRKATLVDAPTYLSKSTALSKPTVLSTAKPSHSNNCFNTHTNYSSDWYTSSKRLQISRPNYNEQSDSDNISDDIEDADEFKYRCTPKKTRVQKNAINRQPLKLQSLDLQHPPETLKSASNTDLAGKGSKESETGSTATNLPKSPYTPSKSKRRKLKISNCFDDMDDTKKSELVMPSYGKQSKLPAQNDPITCKAVKALTGLDVDIDKKLISSIEAKPLHNSLVHSDSDAKTPLKLNTTPVDTYRSPPSPGSPPTSPAYIHDNDIFKLTGTLKKSVFAHSENYAYISSQESVVRPIGMAESPSANGIDNTLQAMLMRELDDAVYPSSDKSPTKLLQSQNSSSNCCDLSTSSKPIQQSRSSQNSCNSVSTSGTTLVPCPVNPNCVGMVQFPYSPSISKVFLQYEKFRRNHERGNADREGLMHIRHKFCSLHAAEQTVIPEGVFKGYLAEIDFKSVKRRVEKMQNIFVNILLGKEHSVFLELTLASFRKLGKWKAQANDTKFSQLAKFQCGYYGWKGGNIIFKAIQSIFRGPDSALNPNTVSPQSVLDYIQNVLVPEAAMRLIAQDQNLNIFEADQLEQARAIMVESAEFGTCVHGDLTDSESDLSDLN